MELANIKLDLAKKLLNTDDKELLSYIKAILDTPTSPDTWFEDLPDEIKKSVEKGLAESEKGQGIPHSDVMKRYSK